MANSLIPYSFVPGTKAMASEVNANFIALAQAVEDGKTFTSESIEDFHSEMEECLDESLGGKLETDLSNCNNITNCILSIPQRIKLELNNGTLTLKAGSVVIVPDGLDTDGLTPKYEYVTIENDVTYTETTTTNVCMLYYSPESNTLFRRGQNTSTTSVAAGFNGVNYNPSKNIVTNYDNGTVDAVNISFPLAITSTTANIGITSIDTLFNGVGYIGSTIWVDKDVKVLAPDYRNSDGTLKNIEYTVPKLKTETFTTEVTAPIAKQYINTNGYFAASVYMSYDEVQNIYIYKHPYGTTYHQSSVALAELTITNGVISNFVPKRVLRIPDVQELEKYKITASKTGSGYMKFPNGMIIQWGELTEKVSTTAITVTLPVPFTTNTYRVFTQMFSNTNFRDFANSASVNGGLKTTSFKLFAGHAELQSYFWFAIGW